MVEDLASKSFVVVHVDLVHMHVRVWSDGVRPSGHPLADSCVAGVVGNTSVNRFNYELGRIFIFPMHAQKARACGKGSCTRSTPTSAHPPWPTAS
jgi:hypothetical protein